MLFLLFRLVRCNIVLMKRFLPLLMLTCLLFGQDLLLLKSGKFYKGVFIDKVDENIIFNIEGDSIHTEISIYNVDIIKTDNGEYYYPFDIPTKIDISTKKEGNDLARIALEFFINPIPFLPSDDVPACIAIPCGFIVFIIVLALNPGSDS